MFESYKALFLPFKLSLLLLVLFSTQVQAQSPGIEISGVGSALTENIRAHLRVGDERCTTPVRRLNRLVPQVQRNTERALQALGMYQSAITIEFSSGEDCWQLHIHVEPGDPVTIASVQVNIDGDPGIFRDILDSPPIRRGDNLNHSLYERLKASISSLAVENGYFNARFTRSDLAIDLANNTADILIDFETGERYRFGTVRISPMDELSERFVSRFIPFESGESYSTDSLVRLRQNLNDSQYFSQVAVTPQLNEASEQHIPVDVELTARLRRSYTTGIGVSTDVGPRVRFAYEDRYINRQGHRLNADLTLSTQQQEPSVSYIIPLRDPSTESLRFSGGFLRQETDSYISNAYRVGVTYRRLVREHWVQNIFTNFQHEKATLASGREQTDSTISGINWSRTRADDPIYPSRGWRVFGQISGAHDSLVSDISFVQLYGSAKLIHSIGPGRVLLRGESATTFVSEVQELPVSERFFTGGDQSVRGYQWGSLGARNADGDVVGGKNLMVGSVEYDFRVRPGWNAAVFYDVGNSFADFGSMNLKRGVGVGARWLSPIGAIRVDIARGLDDGSFRFHLTMGPDL